LTQSLEMQEERFVSFANPMMLFKLIVLEHFEFTILALTLYCTVI